MRIHILFAAIVGFALFQTACGEKTTKTEHGHKFINYTNKGGQKPVPGDKVMVQVATYVGDSLMGSTYRAGGAREVQIPEADKMPAKVPPVFDALVMMGKGDSATVFQELDSMMIASLPPALAKEKTARYTIVLVDIISKADVEKKMEEAKAKGVAVTTNVNNILADYKAGKLGANLKKTASGLEYVVFEQGTGGPIADGDKLKADYYGALKSNGNKFDSSYDRGAPLDFVVGQMIPGFNEGVKLLNHGGKAAFFIPWAIGYGAEGHPSGVIPPKADLLFYVEVQ